MYNQQKQQMSTGFLGTRNIKRIWKAVWKIPITDDRASVKKFTSPTNLNVPLNLVKPPHARVSWGSTSGIKDHYLERRRYREERCNLHCQTGLKNIVHSGGTLTFQLQFRSYFLGMKTFWSSRKYFTSNPLPGVKAAGKNDFPGFLL